MIFPFNLSGAPLGLLAVLTLLPHGILARVAIDSLSMRQFTTSFKIYLGSGPGGCSRNAPNGVSMGNQVLDSLGGANAIAQTMVQDLPTYPTQTYVRGLLFLFFGITFLADHSINPDPVQNNLNAYNNILRRASNEFPSVSVLSSDAHFRKFHCGPTGVCQRESTVPKASIQVPGRLCFLLPARCWSEWPREHVGTIDCGAPRLQM